jgi:hypothetical protein
MNHKESALILTELKTLNAILHDIADSLCDIAQNTGGKRANHLSEINHSLKTIEIAIENNKSILDED